MELLSFYLLLLYELSISDLLVVLVSGIDGKLASSENCFESRICCVALNVFADSVALLADQERELSLLAFPCFSLLGIN